MCTRGIIGGWCNVQVLESVVTVTENQGRFELTIEVSGTDHVPVAAELAFRRGGELRGVEAVSSVKDAFLWRNGFGEYAAGNEVIKFGQGKVDHGYTDIRGGVPKWDGQSVYLTGFTPFRTTLQIT